MKPRLSVGLGALLLTLHAVPAAAGPHVDGPVIALHVISAFKARAWNYGCAATQANPAQNTLAVWPEDYVVHWSHGIPDQTHPNVPSGLMVWLMIANADEFVRGEFWRGGIAGISCGVDWAMVSAGNPYASLEVTWTRCCDLEFPSGDWPAPGGGNRMTNTAGTGDRCRGSEPRDGKITSCFGWFYLSSYYNYLIDRAFVRITPNYNVPVPELAFANCEAAEQQLPFTAAGWVGISPETCPGPDCTLPGCNPYLGPCDAPIPVRATTWGRIKNQFGPTPP
jgi:hypothetical protein